MAPHSLLDLPPEILLQVVGCCPPKSLKSLRQACHTLRSIADPLLFHTVAMYPHMRRMEQVLSLSLQPCLSRHVKVLVYDNSYAGLVDMIIKRIESTYSAAVSVEDKAAMLNTARDFKRSTLEPRRDDDIELLFLHDILRNLPNLDTIFSREKCRMRVTPDNMVNIDNLPDIYSALRRSTCGLHPDFDLEAGFYGPPKQKQTAARILMAAARSRIGRVRSFFINNGIWENITNFEPDGKHITMLTGFIGNLHTLSISAEFDDEYNRELLMSNLGAVLNLAASLRHLTLDFGATGAAVELLTEDEDRPPRSNLGCLLSPNPSQWKPATWPERLSTLYLNNLTCYRAELLTLLSRCRQHLELFVLTNFNLLPTAMHNAEHEEKPCCLVALLHDLHSHLRSCKTIRIGGTFSNTAAQVFRFFPHRHPYAQADETCLASKLFKFLEVGGICPIEALAIQPDHDDMTEEQFEAFKHFHDVSFELDARYFERRHQVSADELHALLEAHDVHLSDFLAHSDGDDEDDDDEEEDDDDADDEEREEVWDDSTLLI